MVKAIISVALCFVISVCSAAVREDANIIIKESEMDYVVKYGNGATDRFVYVFSAHLRSYMNQEGSASKPPFHPFDTRECYYSVGTYIQREGFFITGSGLRVPFEPVKKIFHTRNGKWERNSPVDEVIGNHHPCNDYIGAFDSMKASAKSDLLKAFDVLLLNDIAPESVLDAKKHIRDNVSIDYVK